ncbi:Sapep family Mn(2+)-dependent dipeptidase [Proteiniclasticum sp.]|uniref:Sapep family Mn(2+)-dependent dipeptidase n=1 Tax=Proteiniclasticum sp. TaxID=2053595 RepID=UPI00289C6C70|nr:Sapep family Mn(2+)-dependent dipeptidase [Proteiniclasticum sp.]
MEINQIIEKNKEKLINDVLKLVSFESVKDTAKEGKPAGEKVHAALEEALAMGKAYGFKTMNVDGHAGVIEYGEGEDYVAVLGHLDVVPVGEGWTKNPHGEVSGDRIYGRGTMDDKGPMVSALHGLVAIKESGIELSHRIRLIFGTSEETGGPDIENYLKKEKQPISGFTPDADFPAINAEMGILVIKLSKELKGRELLALEGGQAVNMVPDRTVVRFIENAEEKELSYKGVSAHGSTPHKGENAISMMLHDLKSKSFDKELKDTLSVLDYNLAMDLDGHNMGIDLHDDASGKLVLNLGKIRLENENLETYINIRYPVTFKQEDVTEKIRTIFEGEGFTFEMMAHDGPLYYPKDAAFIKKLMDVYAKETGDHSEPLAIGGGTYAKMMKNIVAFGPLLPGREDTLHQLDEYVLIEDLMTCARIYANAMIELAK